jgi:hypothetical protein
VQYPLEAEIKASGRVGLALEKLRQAGYCRLRPIKPTPLNPIAAFIAAYHIGDPIGPKDAWRPWKRRKAAAREAAKAGRAGKPIAPKTTPARASRNRVKEEV